MAHEWPALLGLVLCFAYIFPSEARLRYLAIYGCGALLAYSLIPYKTPWCIVSILWPFYFLLGAFRNRSHEALRLRHVPRHGQDCPGGEPCGQHHPFGAAELLSFYRRGALRLRPDVSRN